jgi:hypothetical protein
VNDEPRSELELAELALRYIERAMSGEPNAFALRPGEDADKLYANINAVCEAWPVIVETVVVRRPGDGVVFHLSSVTTKPEVDTSASRDRRHAYTLRDARAGPPRESGRNGRA